MTVPHVRYNSPEERKEAMLNNLITYAEEEGLYHIQNITQAAVVSEASRGTVYQHFKTVEGLRDEVMTEAINRKNIAVLAQGLALKNTVALSAPESLKNKASRYIKQG